MVIFEGWKQIADALKYSERQIVRHYEKIKDKLMLEHYFGPGHRMRMSEEEVRQFKILIIEESRKVYRSRSFVRLMADDDIICQSKLFD